MVRAGTIMVHNGQCGGVCVTGSGLSLKRGGKSLRASMIDLTPSVVTPSDHVEL